MSSVGMSQTPLEKVIDSKPVNFVKENTVNKVISGVGAAGAAAVAWQVADKSQIGKAIVTKGVIPAAGVGMVGAGALMVHDGITNDKRSGKERTALLAGGTGLALGGTEIVGR